MCGGSDSSDEDVDSSDNEHKAERLASGTQAHMHTFCPYLLSPRRLTTALATILTPSPPPSPPTHVTCYVCGATCATDDGASTSGAANDADDVIGWLQPEQQRELRKLRKRFKQIERLSSIPPGKMSHDEQTKFESWLHTTRQITVLENQARDVQFAARAAKTSGMSVPAVRQPTRNPTHTPNPTNGGRGEHRGHGSSSASSTASSNVSPAALTTTITGDVPTEATSRPPPLVPPMRRSQIPVGVSVEEAMAAAAKIHACHHRRMEQQRQRRAREAASQAAADAFCHALESRHLKAWQLQMIEHVIQPHNFGLPDGRLRLDLTQERGDSRRRAPPLGGKRQGKSLLFSLEQKEISSMSRLQSVLLRSEPLLEAARNAIEFEKHRYAEDHSWEGPLGLITPLPGETLMELHTRTHRLLLDACGLDECGRRKPGRKPKGKDGLSFDHPKLSLMKTMQKARTPPRTATAACGFTGATLCAYALCFA
jgi:hypothetical protein